MHSGKQTDIAQMLDTADALPQGIRFREAETWQALEQALGQKRRRRVLPLAIAAVLLVAASIISLPTKDAPAGERIAILAPAPAKQIAQQVPQVAIAKITQTVALPKITKSIRKNRQPESAPASEAFITSTPLPADTIATDAVVTTPPPVSKPLPPQQRYRVAHINDAPLYIPEMKPQAEPRGIIGSIFRKGADKNSNPDN